MAKGEGLSPEIEKYDVMWRKDPKSRVFAQLADAYRKSGLYDEAIKVCEEGLKIHPQYASAHVVLGRAYLDKGERNKGVKELEEALNLSPDNLLSLKTLGELYQQEGKLRDALDKFKKAFLLNPLDKQLQAKVDELKDLLSAATPPPLPPLEAKTEFPPPSAPAMAPLPEAPESIEAMPPALLAPEAPAAAPPEAEPEAEALLPPELPILAASEQEPAKAESFMVLDEPEDLGEELSLSLADVEEEEAAAPVALIAPEPAPPVEFPPLKLEELPPLVVEEAPLDKKALDALTTSTLGDLYMEQGFWDRAVEIYQKILELEPHNAQVMAKLSEALARKSAAGAESAEPVFVIPEELVPKEGEAGGPRLGELPLETPVEEAPPPVTAAPSAVLPEQPVVLFSPEDLAAEAEAPALLPVEEKPAAPMLPQLAETRQAPPEMGDTTLIALEKLLTGVKDEKKRRETGV